MATPSHSHSELLDVHQGSHHMTRLQCSAGYEDKSLVAVNLQAGPRRARDLRQSELATEPKISSLLTGRSHPPSPTEFSP